MSSNHLPLIKGGDRLIKLRMIDEKTDTIILLINQMKKEQTELMKKISIQQATMTILKQKIISLENKSYPSEKPISGWFY